MGDSPLSGQDIRAAAEVHRELGPDYGDAVVESFLAKIDEHIEARVEQRLASVTRSARRPVDPVRLGKYRTAVTGAAVGSLVAGVPVSVVLWSLLHQYNDPATGLLVFWVVLVAVYGLAAYRLRRR
jgi:hypothetical protein